MVSSGNSIQQPKQGALTLPQLSHKSFFTFSTLLKFMMLPHLTEGIWLHLEYLVEPNSISLIIEDTRDTVTINRSSVDTNPEEHNSTLFWIQKAHSNLCQVHKRVKIQKIIPLPYSIDSLGLLMGIVHGVSTSRPPPCQAPPPIIFLDPSVLHHLLWVCTWPLTLFARHSVLYRFIARWSWLFRSQGWRREWGKPSQGQEQGQHILKDRLSAALTLASC